MKKIVISLCALVALLLLPSVAEAQQGCTNWYNGSTLLGCYKNWKADGTTLTCSLSGATITCSAAGGAVTLQDAYTGGGAASGLYPPTGGQGGAILLSAAGGGVYLVDTNANSDYSLAVVSNVLYTSASKTPTFWVAANNNFGFGFGGNAPFITTGSSAGTTALSTTGLGIQLSNDVAATSILNNDSKYIGLESQYWGGSPAQSLNNWVAFKASQHVSASNSHPAFSLWELFETESGGVITDNTTHVFDFYYDGTNVNIDSTNAPMVLKSGSSNITLTPNTAVVVTSTKEIQFPGTEGVLHIGSQLNGASADANNDLKYIPAEVAAATWSETFYQATNTGSSRKNQVHAFGWNVGPSGAPLVGGEAMIGFSIESYYNPAGTAGSELHIIVETDGGTLYRPYSMTFDRASGLAQLVMAYDQMFFKTPSGVSTWWLWDNTVGTVQASSASTPITYTVNNVAVLAQARSGGGNANLLKLTSANVVALDPDGVGASSGGALAVAGNITTPGNVGSSATPTSIVYSDNFRATVGLGGLDSKTAGALDIGSANATQVRIGKQDGTGGLIRSNSTSSTLLSPDGNHYFDASNGGGWAIYGNGNSLMMSENGAQVFHTTEVATSFAKDGLIDMGASAQRWRALRGYWHDTKAGAQLTAAATITPTTGLHHVTGATTITTIAVTNVPASATVELTLVADGGTITLNTGGNIGANCTIAQNTHRRFVWDGTTWYAEN